MQKDEFIKRVEKFQEKVAERYKYPFFDGPLNLDSYFDSRLRMMWLMKEPYGDPFSYSQFYSNEFNKFYAHLLKGRPWRTWIPVLYVSFGILNNYLPWSELSSIKPNEDMAKILGQIA